MADRIIISTDEMRTAVSAYETQKNIKLDAIEKMKNAVNVMDSTWDGPASDIFMSAFTTLYPRMMKTEERMEDAINELNRIITEAEEAEGQTVSGLGRSAESMASSV